MWLLRNSTAFQTRLFWCFLASVQIVFVWTLWSWKHYPASYGQQVSRKPEVVIYNRIPKTGSTTLMHLPYKLYKDNGINVMFVNISGGPTSYTMNVRDQRDFVRNITEWSAKFPALYHGHFAYLDTDKFGASNGQVAQINVIRKPIDRLVSYYYFLRYGDDFRINKIRSRMGDKVTFDECVANRQPDCDSKKLWLQVPWFCGHHKRCWSPPGNTWALEQAKINLVTKYWMVGLTEELDSVVQLLEWLLPDFFNGATKLFHSDADKNHIRKTKHKDLPSEDSLSVLQSTKIWKAENEFYEFARVQFKAIKDEFERAKSNKDLSSSHFHYDKVRGPS